MNFDFLRKVLDEGGCEETVSTYTTMFHTLSKLGFIKYGRFCLRSDPVYDMYVDDGNKDCWCEQCTKYGEPYALTIYIATSPPNSRKLNTKEYEINW